MRRIAIPLLIALFAAPPAGAAETRYVSDEVFVVLHSGPGNQYRWLAKLNPGARLDFGRTSDDGDWAEVTTDHGTSGWVKAEFLTATPPAQVRLPAAEAHARELQEQNKQLAAQLDALQSEKTQLTNQLGENSGQLDDVSAELSHLKQISGNAVQLDADNRKLVEQVENLRSQKEMLEAENLRLSDKLKNGQFIDGALAVLLGVVITLVVPRLWPKRRRMSEWA